MTGAELADMLDELLARRPDLSRGKVGMIVRSRRNGIDDLRKASRVFPETVEKVMAFLADPEGARPTPRSEYRYLKDPQATAQRRAAAVRQSSMRKAREHLALGLDLKDASQACVRLAGITVLEQLRDEARQTDPIEQAKVKLQRARYSPVCSMSIYGGDKTMYRVGHRLNVPQDELLKMAARA